MQPSTEFTPFGSRAKKLSGKVALVTGASKGIGAATARHLAAEGAAVVVNYNSDQTGAERVVTEISRHGGHAFAVQGNVAMPDDATRIVEAARSRFGFIDILVNNAGVYEISMLGDITPEHIQKHYATNVSGLIYVTQAALKAFNPNGGSIINVSSVVSSLAPPGGMAYVGSKAAVDVMTEIMAKELGPKNIRVNAINPGMIDTEGLHAAGFVNSPMWQFFEANTPLGRIGNSDDIAKPIVFLASDDAGYISGQTLRVSGGFH